MLKYVLYYCDSVRGSYFDKIFVESLMSDPVDSVGCVLGYFPDNCYLHNTVAQD